MTITDLEELLLLIEKVRSEREKFEEYVNGVIRRMVEETRDYLVTLRKLVETTIEGEKLIVEKLVLHEMDGDFIVHSSVVENCDVLPYFYNWDGEMGIMEWRCKKQTVAFRVAFQEKYVVGLKATLKAQWTVTTILTLTDRENIEAIIEKILEKIEEKRRNIEMVARKYAIVVSPKVQMMLSRLEVLAKTEEGEQQ